MWASDISEPSNFTVSNHRSVRFCVCMLTGEGCAICAVSVCVCMRVCARHIFKIFLSYITVSLTRTRTNK